MNTKLLVLIGLAVLLFGGGYVVLNQQPSSPESETTMMDNSKKTIAEDKPTMEENDERMIEKADNYIDYSKEAFDAANGKKRVYFFHATWCPTCKAANEAFLQMSEKIPADVALFKTDYDTQTDLKKRYNITYQHTFVYVDATGVEIKKWNGGDIDLLVENTK